MAMAMEAMGEEEWEDLGRQAETLEGREEGRKLACTVGRWVGYCYCFFMIYCKWCHCE